MTSFVDVDTKVHDEGKFVAKNKMTRDEEVDLVERTIYKVLDEKVEIN